MRKKKMTLGILAVVIGAVGIVSIVSDRSEAGTAPGECPAMSAKALSAAVAQCAVASARVADEAKGRCPAMQDRTGKTVCPAQKTKPTCPGLKKKNEAKETHEVDYRKMA
mgnify:CR=1 FL=1